MHAAVTDLRALVAAALGGTGLAAGVTGQAAITVDAAHSLARAESSSPRSPSR